MNGQIKFDSKYYEAVKKYLNSQEELRSSSAFGTEGGRLYLTNSRTPKGFILQRCCDNSDQAVVSMINDHPSFKKIKEGLENLTKK